MKTVDPAPRLVDCFTDKIGRKSAVIKQCLVLKRIMRLRYRHCAGIEPAVDYLRDPFHGSAAFRTGESDFINERPVHIERFVEPGYSGATFQVFDTADTLHCFAGRMSA